MTLFEDFVEPFDDLSQWTIVVGTQASATDNHLEINLTGGVAEFNLLHTTEVFEIQNSWVSVQITSPGLIDDDGIIACQVGLYDWDTNENYMLAAFINVVDEELVINDPGHDNFQVSFAPSATPYVAFSGADGDITIWTSPDGTVWTEQYTGLSPFSGQSSLTFVGHNSTGEYPDPWDVSFDNVNELSPFGEAEPTEVDATSVVSEWNAVGAVSQATTSNWSSAQGYLRHNTRHLHKTLFDYLSSHLSVMGWTVEGSVPFNAPVVEIHEVMPDEWDEASVLEPGTVAITIGDENAALNQELGGPLATIEVPFFVDCFMDTPGTTLALALDIRDIFCGRAAGSLRILPVTNYNPTSPVNAPGYTVEFEDVVREKIQKNWEVVKFTACMYFQDVEGG